MQNQTTNYNRKYSLIMAFVMPIVIFLLALIVTLTSCGNPVKKMARMERKYPFYVAEYCESKIEVKTKDSFIYVKGDVETDTAYLMVDCDSAIKTLTKTVKVPYYVNKLRIDTFISYVTVTKKDTFSLGLYKRKSEALDAKMYQLSETKNSAIKWAIIASGMLILFVLFHFNQRR